MVKRLRTMKSKRIAGYKAETPVDSFDKLQSWIQALQGIDLGTLENLMERADRMQIGNLEDWSRGVQFAQNLSKVAGDVASSARQFSDDLTVYYMSLRDLYDKENQ
jgi:hypothetical protein